MVCLSGCSGQDVSIHAARGRTTVYRRCQDDDVVSIHAPARGRAATESSSRGHAEFQSTPPRGGRLHFSAGISAGDVTFQPAAPRGGDNFSRSAAPPADYQSAPARGAAPGRRTTLRFRRSEVSIHAPRGGRLSGRGGTDLATVSTTPRAGGDVSAQKAGSEDLESQSTRPARGATGRKQHGFKVIEFQSTPPRGGDLGQAHKNHVGEVSIHAPRRGGALATAPRHRGFSPIVSIHVPARGRPYPYSCQPGALSFNPRPRAGGDRTIVLVIKQGSSFNPRRQRGRQ